MTNSLLMNPTFGVSAAHPATMQCNVTFIESAVDAAAGTSTIKAVVQLANISSNEHWYRYTDCNIKIGVAGVTQKLTGSQCTFDLAGGHTSTKGTLTWTGVSHRSGSCAVGFSAAWPTGTGGAGLISYSGATLTLNNAPAPPTAPVWPSNSNIVGPTGVGTSTFLNWVNMENKSPAGVTQISPYAAMYLHISQADYPDHFNPSTLASDLSSVAGGSLALSNYAVQTFWYTSLGPTLPSLTAFATNVAASRLLTVKPPANPPKTAQGWGLAVSRGVGVAADPTKVTVQSQSGSTQVPLGKLWTSPLAGPTTTGGPPPSSSFANSFAWSQNTAINLGNSPWPGTINVATIGGFWYQFFLVVSNKAGSVSSVPIIYYANGTAPSLGGGTSGDAGDGNTNVVYSPAANIGVVARALNSLNASASVIPTVAQIIDFSTPNIALTESSSPAALINYCSDPRAYWLTASTAGNTTASPYVAESSAAGYTAHNAAVPPTQMLYALQALGLAEVDRGHTLTFVAGTNNTGSTVAAYVYIGGNPDTPNAAASQAVPAGATSVQVSAMVWINSANVAAGRTVTPFNAIRFNALYANGVSAGSNTQALSPILVNTLAQVSASWPLPASTSRVVAALVANTASGAAWNGGYGAGESVTATGFMMLFNQMPNTPYFDGGYPNQPSSAYAIHTSADLAVTTLGNITNTRDGHAAGVP